MEFWNKEVKITYHGQRKVIRTDGTRLPDGQDIDEAGYTYFWEILETDEIKEKEFFLTGTWLPHSQLWATDEGAASLT